MTPNPWLTITPGDYDAHMSHPVVMQTQALEQITKEQFELISPDVRDTTVVAILGIANGNGLRHANAGHIIGVDINQSFLDECVSRYPDLAERFTPLCIDLIVQWQEAIDVLSNVDLIIANLLVEHVGLDHFTRIMRGLTNDGTIISCVIQVNPDGSIASHSGCEHVFDEVVTLVTEVDEAALTTAMTNVGYSKRGRNIYELPNGKQFYRLDYCRT